MPARCFSPLEALKVIGKRYRSIELGMLTEPHLGSERRSTHRPRHAHVLVARFLCRFNFHRGARGGHIGLHREGTREIA